MIQPAKVFSVHELNEYVSLVLGNDRNLVNLTVEGELSGCKRHPNGHFYFTLKDEQASVSCVMWRQQASMLAFVPRDGLRVRMIGTASLYTRDGRFQIYAKSLTKQGDGDLFAAFCRYRDELNKLGWFDQSIKKKIPKLPACVGVVTSSSGAALQDIRNIIGRRFPSMPIRVYHAAVQGAGASDEIANAIDFACAENVADVLIVGRGGGSLEDLWAFNEPAVAEAIHRCSIPVISAVGHETDFSISDFVADLRAPTPSAAAELAVPELSVLKERLKQSGERLAYALRNGLKQKQHKIEKLWMDRTTVRIQMRISNIRQKLDEIWTEAAQAQKDSLVQMRFVLQKAMEKVEAYNPKRTLQRGFSMLYDQNNVLITSTKDIHSGESVIIQLSDGHTNALITGKDDR
jgi:exodeoxyribonuclease VII, large subunit